MKRVQIRLLVSVAGDHRSAVKGDAGDVLTVDAAEAAKWVDGTRAERVDLVREVPVEHAAVPATVETTAAVPPEAAAVAAPATPQRAPRQRAKRRAGIS